MIRALDRALGELVGPIPSLRAAVLSAAPDGLIAWSWTRASEPEIALDFARLDRAATACLETLGAGHESRSMLLCARDTWVVAWPLRDGVHHLHTTGTRLILTLVFSGELQSGMVMVYGQRVLARLRAALERATDERDARLRTQLVELTLHDDDPLAALEQLVDAAGADLRRLERIDTLADDERRRLESAAADRLRRVTQRSP